MSKDTKTLSVYDMRAEDYAAMRTNAVEKDLLNRFIRALPPGGRVLDFGCGPGQAAATMQRAGLKVDAVDGSAEMVALAARRPGVMARQETFDMLDARDEYDGVYASFSLLHARRLDFPRHLEAIHRALRPGGIFFIGMKLGRGEKRDSLGRFYTYYSPSELVEILEMAGFTPNFQNIWHSSGLAGGQEEMIGAFANA
jgi:SAM-dependent methyltransferase